MRNLELSSEKNPDVDWFSRQTPHTDVDRLVARFTHVAIVIDFAYPSQTPGVVE